MHDDPLVRNIGRLSAVICVIFAAAAAALAGWRVAAGVLGGGVLIGVSFYTVGGGVAAIVAAASGQGPSPKRLGRTVLHVVLRYALLGFLAYVMIARLRLHPIGLLVGASSVPAAAVVEAVRLHVKRS